MIKNKWALGGIFLAFILLVSCGKKMHPAVTPGIIVTSDTTTAIAEADSVTNKENPDAVIIKKSKPAVFPKIITVNDKVASKSTDGRLYYDVMGHRYWKNYKDGKYYLYSKSMYKNPDFKVPTSD